MQLLGLFGVIYQNPKGLSTDKDDAKVKKRELEQARVIALYSDMWAGKKLAKADQPLCGAQSEGLRQRELKKDNHND